ncbi:MAG TPA: aminotransferase class V-fold PLP-dependent enzyme, partial [Tepidisphaeraceae bacterium]|nr:aminotransferase class V-fold PLP-dependent enzyme [Tepidisphaeraceae bacterium]
MTHSNSHPPRRLYLDNAATSFPKPPAVLEAMVHYATHLGASAGRGAYREAIETGQLISDCRRALNHLFNGQNPDHFIFTLNCSEALNLAIKGLISHARQSSSQKPHAICTHIDHNSILRPLNALSDLGQIEQTRIPVHPSTGLIDPNDIRKSIRPTTRLIALTHASNVTGTLQPLHEIGLIARSHNIPLIVDAAQSAGHIPIDLQADHIDLLAAPGHKGLLGPLGTGLLYIRPGIEKILSTFIEGGTGSLSENDRQPDFLPDKYEPGSHNAIGLAGLLEGLRFLADRSIEKIAAHQSDLIRAFLDGISDIEGLTYYGPRGVRHRVGVFSIRIDGLEPHELAAILETHYGILTRPGLHCAPLAHQTLGTTIHGGTTR